VRPARSGGAVVPDEIGGITAFLEKTVSALKDIGRRADTARKA
jgi:hypothetical protein